MRRGCLVVINDTVLRALCHIPSMMGLLNTGAGVYMLATNYPFHQSGQILCGLHCGPRC